MMTSETSASQNWLKLGEAAFALGVSEITLRRKIKAGRIPYELRDGKYFVLVDGTSGIPDMPATPQLTRPKPQQTVPSPQATPTLTRQRPSPRFAAEEAPINQRQPAQAPSEEALDSFSHSLMAATMERARLQARIEELELMVQEQNEIIIDLRRQFEDQQTLIAFLEDRVRQAEH